MNELILIIDPSPDANLGMVSCNDSPVTLCVLSRSIVLVEFFNLISDVLRSLVIFLILVLASIVNVRLVAGTIPLLVISILVVILSNCFTLSDGFIIILILGLL